MGQLAKNEHLQVVKQNNKYGIDDSTWSALKNSLYTGAKDESIKMVIDYCKAGKLDPLQKPVHIVPMSVKDAATGKYSYKDIIMAGIGLYRIQAARSGKYAGVSEPEYGEDVTETLCGSEVTYPKWCKVTVKKIVDGTIVEFAAKEYWLENYASNKSNAPNAMWAKRPYGQLAKCAEAQALRKAFPEFVSQQPTAEEMEGKVLLNAQSTQSQINNSQQVERGSNLDKFLEKEAPKLEVVKDVVEEDIHLKLVRLAEMHKLSEEKVQSWCKAGDVESLMDLDEAKTIACINSLEAQSGVNGHSVLKQV
jgi:phage recombination protein Bet